jgi:hypothetical protein
MMHERVFREGFKKKILPNQGLNERIILDGKAELFSVRKWTEIY